jgi:hypothetical protein
VDGDGELPAGLPGWAVQDGVADQFAGDEFHVIGAGCSSEDAAHEPARGWDDGG